MQHLNIPGTDPSICESRFSSICTTLGIRIKDSKSITGKIANFNNIRFNTLAMDARLPQQKLTKARGLVTATAGRRSITLYELQSITGYLAFCAEVIPTGRSFLHRLYHAATPSITNGPRSRLIPIATEMRLDLHWWS